jgi:hypothetical protein
MYLHCGMNLISAVMKITCSKLRQDDGLDFPGEPRRSLVYFWPKIIKDLMEDEDFGIQLKKNIPRTSDLDALLTPVKDPYKKMAIIHDYVRKICNGMKCIASGHWMA